MTRTGSIPADICDFLRDRPDGASIGEIAAALSEVRRSEVLRPSVRSAIYQHREQTGEGLFRQVSRGRYALNE